MWLLGWPSQGVFYPFYILFYFLNNTLFFSFFLSQFQLTASGNAVAMSPYLCVVFAQFHIFWDHRQRYTFKMSKLQFFIGFIILLSFICYSKFFRTFPSGVTTILILKKKYIYTHIDDVLRESVSASSSQFFAHYKTQTRKFPLISPFSQPGRLLAALPMLLLAISTVQHALLNPLSNEHSG